MGHLTQLGRFLTRARLTWAVVAIALSCKAGTAVGECGDYLAHPSGAQGHLATNQFDPLPTPAREGCHGKQCGQHPLPMAPAQQQRLAPSTEKYTVLASQSLSTGDCLSWLLGIPPADGCGTLVCSEILRPPRV